MPGLSRVEASGLSPSPSHDSHDRFAAADRLVVGVIAVLDVLAEQGADRVAVVALPRLNVVGQPPVDAGAVDHRSSRRISLPDAVRGSSAANSTRFGTLYPASSERAVRAQVVGSHVGALAEHDHRGHRLLPLGVGASDDRGLGDLRVAQQHLLDLAREHVLAAGDDHVAEPAGDVEEAVLVDPARGRRCAASRPRRRPRGRPSGPGRGSRRPGSAGGWSAAAAPPSRGAGARRRATASSPARPPR